MVALHYMLYLVLISISTGDILNPGDTSINNTNWYFMLLTGGVMYVVYYIMELIYHSPFGRALRAIREDDTSALSIGKSFWFETKRVNIIKCINRICCSFLCYDFEQY